MKITIIDSGLGGAIFAKNIKYEFPELEVILSLDKEGFPYGDKELIWLKERLIKLVEEAKTETVLIACNTLSCIIYKFNLKFIKTVVDVVSPTTYFFNLKSYKHICILATKNTINMDIYTQLINAKISYIDASELIKDLEKRNDFNDSLTKLISDIPQSCDVLLLGCTHLIDIKNEFRKILKQDVISQDEIFMNFSHIKTFFIYKTIEK